MQPLRGSRPVFYVTQEFVRKSNLGDKLQNTDCAKAEGTSGATYDS